MTRKDDIKGLVSFKFLRPCSEPFLSFREGRPRIAGGRPEAASGQASRRYGGGAASWMGGAGRRRGGGDGAAPWTTLLTPWAGRSTKLPGIVRKLLYSRKQMWLINCSSIKLGNTESTTARILLQTTEKEYFEAILTRSVHCKENPIYVRYSQKRNCAVSVLISTFVCICERFIYSHDRSTYVPAAE